MSETQAGEKIGFYKVDVEEEHMIPKELKISAMPTFVLFKDGAPVETVVGADASKLQVSINYTLHRTTAERLGWKSTLYCRYCVLINKPIVSPPPCLPIRRLSSPNTPSDRCLLLTSLSAPLKFY